MLAFGMILCVIEPLAKLLQLWQLLQAVHSVFFLSGPDRGNAIVPFHSSPRHPPLVEVKNTSLVLSS